jgi:hypothetical protein
MNGQACGMVDKHVCRFTCNHSASAPGNATRTCYPFLKVPALFPLNYDSRRAGNSSVGSTVNEKCRIVLRLLWLLPNTASSALPDEPQFNEHHEHGLDDDR